MKKSRIAIAVILAVVLAVTCISVPTFSWFTRPQPESQSGANMMLKTNNTYNVYNGYGVTVSTMGSNDSGITYETDCSAANACSGSEIGIHNRKFFCSTITNSTNSEQNVSLYARTLSIPAGTNGTLALGVNGPTRSYHDYSSLTNKTYNTALNYDKRIYFQTHGVSEWESGQDIYVTFGYEYGDKTYKMNYITHDNTWGHIYYADLPYTANRLYFTVSGWQTANHGSEDWTMRSAEVSGLDNTVNSINQSKVFRILNQEDGNHNRPIEIGSVNGASIKEYYSSITLATNAEFEAATELRYQTGATVEYYSSNSSVFTVNANGVITGVGAGTATLYTKVVGGTYGDFIQKETEINVTPNNSYVFYDVPIVRNMKIPANGTQEVYWYVINNSLTNALSYTIDEVYIGL